MYKNIFLCLLKKRELNDGTGCNFKEIKSNSPLGLGERDESSRCKSNYSGLQEVHNFFVVSLKGNPSSRLLSNFIEFEARKGTRKWPL
jgi:hypothetical protein